LLLNPVSLDYKTCQHDILSGSHSHIPIDLTPHGARLRRNVKEGRLHIHLYKLAVDVLHRNDITCNFSAAARFLHILLSIYLRQYKQNQCNFKF